MGDLSRPSDYSRCYRRDQHRVDSQGRGNIEKALSLVPEKGGNGLQRPPMDEAKRQGITLEAAETKFLK